jgi:hypothetical protein
MRRLVTQNSSAIFIFSFAIFSSSSCLNLSGSFSYNFCS